MNLDEKNILIKKLLYLSKNRGYKETELILSNISKKFLLNMTISELNDYLIILNYPDDDIYSWITAKSSIPKHLNHNLIQLLKNTL